MLGEHRFASSGRAWRGPRKRTGHARFARAPASEQRSRYYGLVTSSPSTDDAPLEATGNAPHSRGRIAIVVGVAAGAVALLLHGAPPLLSCGLVLLALTATSPRRDHPRTGWRRLALGRGATTRTGQALRAALSLLAGGYLVLLAEPAPLFSAVETHAGFQLRSDLPLPPSTAAVLQRAAARLRTSPLNDPTLVHRVHLCHARWRLYLLAPSASSSLAQNHSMLNSIVVNGGDVAADRIVSPSPPHASRSLSGVIAHEAVHTLIRQRIGALGTVRLLPWVDEGYCDYVAGESTFDIALARAMIAVGRGDSSPAFYYARARLLVEQLLDFEAWSVDDVLNREIDEAAQHDDDVRCWK